MYTKRQRPPHVSDETQQEMCRTPPGMAPDLERGPPIHDERQPSLIDRLKRQWLLAKDHDGLRDDLHDAITELERR